MNGDRLVADTNALIYFLEGDQTAISLLDGMEVFISFVSELELLGSKKATTDQLKKVERLLSDVTIIDINQHVKELVIMLRKRHAIKLPDALIAATAIHMNLPLVTADKGFDRLKEELALYRF